MNLRKIGYRGVFLILLGFLSIYGYFTLQDSSRLPIVFDATNTPCIPIYIQGKPHLLGMDFGATFELALKQDLLMTLKKHSPDFVSRKDAWGTTRFQLSYKINHVKLGKHSFSEVKVLQMTRKQALKEMASPIRVQGQTLEKEGFIGAPLLENTNLLMDFPHSVIFSIPDKARLSSKGYFLEKFIKVPFQKKRSDIFILVKTSFGELTFLLDTGCTHCIIKASLLDNTAVYQDYVESAIFSLGGQDFGSTKLYPLNLDPDSIEDGILGMDFLREHILYMDQKEQAIYLSK